jgi:glycosyltransferase involved in cell wall biosynthesis
MSPNNMSPKRILIDGFNLDLEEGTGISSYARNLSYVLHDLGHDVHVLYGRRSAPANELLREIAFFDSNVGEPPAWLETLRYFTDTLISPFGPRARSVPITGKVIRTPFQSRMPYFDRLWNAPNIFGKADWRFRVFKRRTHVSLPTQPHLAHWTYPLPLRIFGAKNIYTLHDLVPLRLPYATLDVKSYYFRLVRLLARRADHILTVSENSRRDIISLLGINEDRVTNTYQSVDIPEIYATKPQDTVRREVEGAFNLRYMEYMLFFGAIEPKKNVGRLIEAYLASQIETPLVIVGKSAWMSAKELRFMNNDIVRYLETIDSNTLTRYRVQRIDYVPFPLLISLIRGAKAVLFPSLYEGFGLPALEAMKLGTPTLVSNAGSLPEVAGDASIIVDPYDVRSISEGIRALDSRPELRAELVAKGVKQAALFSTEAYKKRLGAVYDRLI